MVSIVEILIYKKCIMRCKKNKYEIVIYFFFIMKLNNYLMNNVIVIVSFDFISSINIYRFLCGFLYFV